MYEEKLDINDSLRKSAFLVNYFGNIKLEKEVTLQNLLLIDDIPLWEIISPELAHSFFPKVLASKGPPSSIDKLKSNIASIRFFLKKRKISIITQSPKVFSSQKKTCLFLGFTEQMYRDVLHPLLINLDNKKEFNLLTLRNQKRSQYEDLFTPQCKFDSIWNYYDKKIEDEYHKILSSIKNIKPSIRSLKKFIKSLPNDLSYLEDHFIILFNYLFDYYLKEIVLHAILARKILKLHRPKIVISPDMADSRSRIYSFLSRSLKIKSLDIQFGLAGNEAVEWIFFASDFVAVWGLAAKKILMEYGVSDSKIKITGSPRHDFNFKLNLNELISLRKKNGVKAHQKLLILASTYSLETHERYSNPNLLIEMKKSIFRAITRNRNIFLLVKPHPCENTSELKKLIGNSKNISIIDKKNDIRDLIAICDFFISFGSTATLDALIAEKVTILPIFQGWIFSEIFKNSGSAIIIESDEGMQKLMANISSGKNIKSSTISNARKVFLKHMICQSKKSSVTKVSNLIFKIIKDN